MSQDSSRDLTPVVPKKHRATYMMLMLGMMFLSACLALTLDMDFVNQGCVVAYADSTLILTKLANLLLGGLFYLCLLKKGQKFAFVAPLVILILGLVLLIVSGFVTLNPVVAAAPIMLGCGALAMACFNSVLALGPVKTALRRLNFSLVLIPLGVVAGFWMNETSFVSPLVGQAILLVCALGFLLKSRSASFEQSVSETSEEQGAWWRVILCGLGLFGLFFFAVDSSNYLLEVKLYLAILSVIPAFWLGFYLCKKGLATKLFILAPVLVLFTPLSSFVQVQDGAYGAEIFGIGSVYFMLALGFPMLLSAALKGYEAPRPRLCVLVLFLMVIAVALGISPFQEFFL